MKKFQDAFTFGGIGALAGAVIGEFFPKLFNTGFFGSLGNVASEPFSGYRNEMALKYALAGLVIGAVVGIVMVLVKKR